MWEVVYYISVTMKFYHKLQEWDPIMPWLGEHFGPIGDKWDAGSEFDMMYGRLRYFITIKDPHNALLFSLVWPCEVADENR